ncbi:MAG TPA: oligosaccharide flippase family protein [Ktedonobacteraceae bacterium]|nr:oligosaccharide flippase family protein [Ktedonobacteraceae bacterium]
MTTMPARRPLLRPLRLVGIKANELDNGTVEEENGNVEDRKDTRGLMQPISDEVPQLVSETPPVASPEGEVEARLLLKRTPGSYLLNQAYGLWVFASLFLLTVVVTRKLSVEQYGVYAIAMAAFNTIAYIVALGLEDATTTFVPRVFAEHGRASAASLIRRLLLLRSGILVLSVGIMLFALPLLASLIEVIPFSGSAGMAASLRDPTLLNHITPIAVYVLGNGISGLITAVCASLMRMRFVFVVGSATQFLLLGLSYVVLQLGFGTDGVLWLFALVSLLNALAFIVWLAPLLFARGATYIQPLKPVIHLGISAWLTNLVSGALLKQVSIILLGYFAVSLIEIGYFNLSFQLAHAASLLLVSGFGGVSGAALAAAFVGRNYDRLARSWQALIKIETLLATPILVFCLFNAQNVAHVLYGSNYDPVGPLFAIFLFFNIIARVLGTTIHQYAMYVIGKPQLVVLSQWLGLVAVFIVGILLIPRWGPAGALVADGIAQIVIGGMLLAFLWRALPRKYPLGFTFRFMLGLVLAALPSILWHPSNRYLLGVSGVIFFLVCIVLLLLIKPLNSEDVSMVGTLNTRVASYLQRFARNEK